jgi:hypothetical protein
VFYNSAGRCLGCAVILEALEGTPKPDYEAIEPEEEARGKPFQTIVKKRRPAGQEEE